MRCLPRHCRRFVDWNCFLLASAALVFLAGCSGSTADIVKVSGKVTYDGQPVKVGNVQFLPVAGQTGVQPATGMILEDGSYQMTSVHGKGVQPGNYQVSVSSMESIDVTETPMPPKYLVPEKYSTPQTSGLTVEVKAGAAMTHDITLTK